MGIIGGPPRPRAHPRSRGENFCAQSTARSTGGSSPLTRGKQWTVMQRVSAAGLIPAHAGKTPGRLDIHVSAWAHPRSRGENRVIKPGGYLLAGSSPLTRGKRFAAGGQGTSPGLIPAHAGKTPRRRRGGWYSGAHPRSRGENSAALGYETPSRGSSPLTRGKHHRRRQRAQTCGLIPAHAGKTQPS